MAVIMLMACGSPGDGPPPTTPIDPAPVLTGPSRVEVREGEAVGIQLEASNADGGNPTVALGGEDAGRFVLTADLTILAAAPLDFELPTDADRDNRYSLVVTASDGEARSELALTVEVLDVDDTALERTGGLLLLGARFFDFEDPRIGSTLAALRDLDGDGRPELAIGAPEISLTEDTFSQGRVFVVPGAALATQEDAVVPLGPLAAAHGLRLDGHQENGFAGAGLTALGDVNGDGVDELVIGAPQAREVYVFGGNALSEALGSGAPVGLGEVGTGGPARGALLFSSNDGDRDLGDSVHAAGDVDGDGTPDLVVCDPFGAVDGSSSVGRAFVVFGDALAPALASDGALDLDSATPGTHRVVVDGVASSRGTCQPASSAGDVDGDGKDDLLITTRASGRARNVHLVFGATIAAARAAGGTLGLADALASGGAVRFDPVTASGLLQLTVSSVPDLDGDGDDEILIGDRDEATTYLIYGSDSLGGVVELGSVVSDGLGVEMIGGGPLAEGAGIFSAPAGDLDGDGLAEVLISADDFESGSGTVFVVPSGELLAPATIDLLQIGEGAPGLRITNVEGDGCCNSAPTLLSAGDLDGDGVDEIVLGDFRADDDVGNVFVLAGWLLSEAMASGGNLDLVEHFGDPGSRRR